MDPSIAATTTRALAALRDFHRPRIEALVEAGADLLAFETIPTIREAEVLVGLLDEIATPAWLSFSCRDGRSTSAGEAIETAVAVGAHPRIVAVGINCTAPRHLPDLLAAARTATDLPLIAYPNGGERWDAASRRWLSDDGGGFDPVDGRVMGRTGCNVARRLLRDRTGRHRRPGRASPSGLKHETRTHPSVHPR